MSATGFTRMVELFDPDAEVQAACFCTYGLEAAFFETEVLPALLPRELPADRLSGSGAGYHHAADEALQRVPVDVFYDHLREGTELLAGYRQVNLGGAAFHPKLILVAYADR